MLVFLDQHIPLLRVIFQNSSLCCVTNLTFKDDDGLNLLINLVSEVIYP